MCPLGLALAQQGTDPEARRKFRAVLDERAPTNPADWMFKDSREARTLLEAIESKP